MTSVSDNLLPNAVGISCYSTYSHALLLGLADPYSMSVRQIELTDRWLGMWARKVFPYAQQRETEGPVILIDLDGGSGATLAPSAPANPASSMRFGYPGKLSTSVRGRLKRLQSGANPAELQLGHDCSIEQCTTLLGHLDSRWYQRRRGAGRARRRGRSSFVPAACPAAYFRVSGRTFERKDPAGRLSFAEAQQLQAIAAIGDYDRGREGAEAEWAWEQWQGTLEPRDALVVRESDPVRRWMLDQLAMLRSDGVVRVGYVTRVAMGGDGQLGAEGQLALTLRLWSAAPVAMTLLPLSAASSDDPPLPALRLDETPDDKPSLRAAAAHLQSEPRVALPRHRSGSPLSVDAPPAARQRLRARLLRRDALKRRDATARRRAPATGAASMPNRLAGETSPYLIQHAGNPVDWHPVGRRGARARATRRKADPAVDRLLGVPLVPRDGARVVRGSAGRGGDERGLRQHQGRPRGAARPRPDLPDGPRAHDAALGRLAADDVPHAGRRAVFRRNLFPEGGALRLAGLSRPSAAGGRGLSRARRRHRRTGGGAQERAREPRAGTPADASHCRRPPPLRRSRSSSDRFDPEHGGFGAAPKFPHATDLEFCLRGARADERRRSARDRPRDACEDGRGRHSRSAGRRLLPLQRRCAVDDPALREDALRQRTAARAVRGPGAGDRRHAVRRRGAAESSAG